MLVDVKKMLFFEWIGIGKGLNRKPAKEYNSSALLCILQNTLLEFIELRHPVLLILILGP